jgi:demethylmenaquinone methyltransferase/2-methoxy-6-polyprenyl-1,4-benzoquinol methylase
MSSAGRRGPEMRGMRVAPPEHRVAGMFDDLVGRYDLVNDLLSMGLDRWWRRRAAHAVPLLPGDRVLDLGCGTGRLAELLAPRADVAGVDVSIEMVRAARARGRKSSARLHYLQGSAFALPFDDGVFMGAVSGFVLRNLNDLQKAFDELARVVAPGGAIALVDITGPRNHLLRRGFDAYFGTVAPLLGRMVGEEDAYRYLARSLAQLPRPEELAAMLRRAGFPDARPRPLSFGMVTLWTGTRAQ